MTGARANEGGETGLPAQMSALRAALDTLLTQIASVSAALDATVSAAAGVDQVKPCAAPEDRAEVHPVDRFRWESDTDGIIRWVDGAPRGAIVGRALPAAPPPRGTLRDVTLHFSGSDAVAGDWILSAAPAFDPASGRFLGHRGEARRAPGAPASAIPPDMMRQLVHEIRTPLNAIMGFAGMIDGEHLGPADPAYRARAAKIVAQAGQVLATVDSLDEDARRASACQTRGASAIGEAPGEGL
jgi:hypothetical protein